MSVAVGSGVLKKEHILPLAFSIGVFQEFRNQWNVSLLQVRTLHVFFLFVSFSYSLSKESKLAFQTEWGSGGKPPGREIVYILKLNASILCLLAGFSLVN